MPWQMKELATTSLLTVSRRQNTRDCPAGARSLVRMNKGVHLTTIRILDRHHHVRCLSAYRDAAARPEVTGE